MDSEPSEEDNDSDETFEEDGDESDEPYGDESDDPFEVNGDVDDSSVGDVVDETKPFKKKGTPFVDDSSVGDVVDETRPLRKKGRPFARHKKPGFVPAANQKRVRSPAKNIKKGRRLLKNKKMKKAKTGNSLLQLQDQSTLASIPSASLVNDDDKPLTTPFVYQILKYLRPALFTNADYIGSHVRHYYKVGFKGFCCSWCVNSQTVDYRPKGRYFPSSEEILRTKGYTRLIIPAYKHMIQCWGCPLKVRDELEMLFKTHMTETKYLKFGTRDTLLARVWCRLHEECDDEDPLPSTEVVPIPSPIQEVHSQAPISEANHPLVIPQDAMFASAFLYQLVLQLKPCAFELADRHPKRKHNLGYPGVACLHCFDCYSGYGGRVFASTSRVLYNQDVVTGLYNHMMCCSRCPLEVRDNLETLRKSDMEERSHLKKGWLRSFFDSVWERLHGPRNTTV